MNRTIWLSNGRLLEIAIWGSEIGDVVPVNGLVRLDFWTRGVQPEVKPRESVHRYYGTDFRTPSAGPRRRPLPTPIALAVGAQEHRGFVFPQKFEMLIRVPGHQLGPQPGRDKHRGSLVEQPNLSSQNSV